MSVIIPPATQWCCPIACCDFRTVSRSSSITLDDVQPSSSSSSSSSSPCITININHTDSVNNDILTLTCTNSDGCRWICQPNQVPQSLQLQEPSPSSVTAVVTPAITTSTPSSTETSTTAAAAAAASTINALISSSSALSTLAEHTLAYVNVHGMCMLTSALHTKHAHVQERKEGQHDHQVEHLPVSLLPTKMSRSGFNLVNQVAPLINTLMDHIARDSEFLNTTLATCITVDPFQRRLLDIYNRVKNEGKGMDLTLSINRADYMLDGDDMIHAHPLQVEVNTISAGLITLAQRVQELHSFILERHVPSMVDDDISGVEHPPNHSFDGLISAMKLTVDTFRTHHMTSSPKPRIAILFVVQPLEFNISDQRQIEYALYQRYHIPVYRRTLTQIHDMNLTNERHLIIDGYTIALVYFRSGYAPTDFPTEKEWNALYMLETATTVKCPDVGHHLAGTKKIQQVLAQPGVVERFLPASDAALVRSTYTGLYALDNDSPATQAIIADAIANPHSYVLKPQRNGGGNNFFGNHVANILSTSTVQERQQYILMKRIKPVVQLTATIREGQVHVTPCSSELGIFAAHLGSASKGVLLNTSLGYLLRTKKAESDEGGVASGNAVVDSAMLV